MPCNVLVIFLHRDYLANLKKQANTIAAQEDKLGCLQGAGGSGAAGGLLHPFSPKGKVGVLYLFFAQMMAVCCVVLD